MIARAALIAAALLALAGTAAADPGPPGYRTLIAERPELRQQPATDWPVDLALVERINAEENARPYQADPEGLDLWGIGADCEDYAIRKMQRLLAAGVPRGALRFMIFEVDGQGHAVLVVSDRLVLDNRTAAPLPIAAYGPRAGWWEALADDGNTWAPAIILGRLDQLAERALEARP